MQKQKYQAYATATQTVARTRQIVMLYDGAIRFMQQAKEAVSEKHIERRYQLLTKTSDIISGLQASLDFDNGGQMAKLLYQFYDSVSSRIFSIHRSNSVETCDEVIEELKRMRDTWHEIDHTMSHTAYPAPGHPAAEPASASADNAVTLSA